MGKLIFKVRLSLITFQLNIIGLLENYCLAEVLSIPP